MRFLDTSLIRCRLDERVMAPDGTELSVDLYLPPEPGRYPVLLHRTAADNNRFGRAGISMPQAERWKSFAAQGYVVATADARGRGDSDGEFTPFVHEARDGAATIAWLRNHRESNGKVGLLGSGYGAFCAWAAAVADRQVQAIVSVSPLGAVGRGLPHRDGAVRLDWLFWMHLVGGRSVQPASVPPWQTINRHLPLQTMDAALGRADIWWQDWLAHPDPEDPFWLPLDLADRIAALDVPGLHVTGWWDGMARAAYYYHRAASNSRARQELIIGPWDTAALRHPALQVGGFDFGPRSVLDLDDEIVGFFNRHLGDHQAAVHAPLIRLFVTGRNEWVDARQWPAGTTKALTLHIASDGAANTRCGDGLLSPSTPLRSGVDVITDNPELPVDFQPQFTSFATGANPLGFVLDQSHITARDEALVYTSQPLASGFTVKGRPRVTLTIQVDAPDADLFVLLSDCFPFGVRDLHLAHGALRLATLEQFTPGSPLEVVLELDDLAHDFLPNHHVRLTVVPSLFPLYARNPHRVPYVAAHRTAIARIQLRHGPELPAMVELPLGEEFQ